MSKVRDFSKKPIQFGAYLCDQELECGDIIFLIDDDGNTDVIMIGNATPYMGVSTSDGGLGWDYNDYNAWRVVSVSKYSHPNFLRAEKVQKVYESRMKKER